MPDYSSPSLTGWNQCRGCIGTVSFLPSHRVRCAANGRSPAHEKTPTAGLRASTEVSRDIPVALDSRSPCVGVLRTSLFTLPARPFLTDKLILEQAKLTVNSPLFGHRIRQSKVGLASDLPPIRTRRQVEHPLPLALWELHHCLLYIVRLGQ